MFGKENGGTLQDQEDGPENKQNDPENIPVNDINKSFIRKDILSLAWPSVTELGLATLCDMINMIMVGKLGAYAITAVGLTSQPKFVMLATFVSLNVGATAITARMKGENDPEGASAVLRQCLILTFALASLVSILGVIFSRNMIILMGAAADTIEAGTGYFRILMSGFVLSATTLCISSILRGVGNTKASMRYNISANVVNVTLNFLLIDGKLGFPALGVKGAALATVTGWSVAFIMALTTVLRGRHFVSLSLKGSFKPDFDILKRVIRIGLPAAGEQLALRLGLLFYVRVVAGLGTVVYATHQISLNILQTSFMSGQALGIAATSLMGQSLGRKRPDLAKAYTSETRRIGILVSIFIGICFFLFGTQLVSLFTNDPEIIRNGSIVLKFIALLQPFQSSFLILSGALKGAGSTRIIAVTVFTGVMVIRPILALIFVYYLGWGLIGAWIALFSDQLFRSVIAYFYFASNRWMTAKV